MITNLSWYEQGLKKFLVGDYDIAYGFFIKSLNFENEIKANFWLYSLVSNAAEKKLYRENIEKRKAELMIIAAKSSATADDLCILAIGYSESLGLGSNQERSYNFYQRAANKNHPVAQYCLGLLFEEGSAFVVKNVDTAYVWYTKAALGKLSPWGGFINAKYAVLRCHQNNIGINGSVVNYRKLCDVLAQDDPVLQYNIAESLYYGEDRLRPNLKLAFYLFKKVCMNSKILEKSKYQEAQKIAKILAAKFGSG